MYERNEVLERCQNVLRKNKLYLAAFIVILLLSITVAIICSILSINYFNNGKTVYGISQIIYVIMMILNCILMTWDIKQERKSSREIKNLLKQYCFENSINYDEVI